MQLLPEYKPPRKHYFWGEFYGVAVLIIGTLLFPLINHVTIDENTTLDSVLSSEKNFFYICIVVLASLLINILIFVLGLIKEKNYHKKYHKILSVYSKEQLIKGILHAQSRPKEINIVLKYLRSLEDPKNNKNKFED